jgi:RNA polymerase sigma-70 factor, ECF subfamily
MRGKAVSTVGEPVSFDLARVRAVLVMSGVSWDAIDDALQLVRFKVHERQQDETETLRDVTAWAVVAASRVAMDMHRAEARHQSLRRRLEQAWEALPANAHESGTVMALDVADELDKLTALQRQVLILRYYQDLSVSDIATVLDVPPGTIKSRLHDAEAAMKRHLSREGA